VYTTTATATEFGLRQVSLSSAASRELVRRGVCEGAIRLYAYLTAHSRNRSGEAFASQRYLAAELGRTARTIRNYLRQLEAAGVVATRRTGRAARYRVEDLSGTGFRTTEETAFRSQSEEGDSERRGGGSKYRASSAGRDHYSEHSCRG